MIKKKDHHCGYLTGQGLVTEIVLYSTDYHITISFSSSRKDKSPATWHLMGVAEEGAVQPV